MLVRRAAAWITTAMVAIIVALAVPVSQLRTVLVIKACCCPDPDHCHCPTHKSDASSQPTMRTCHNTERTLVAPELPVFDPPAIALAAPTVRVIHAIAPAIPAPHPSPAPTRPDAPS